MLYIFWASLVPLLISVIGVVLTLMGTEIPMLNSASDLITVVLMLIGLSKLAKESDKFRLSRTIYIVVLILNIVSLGFFSSINIDLGFMVMHGAFIAVVGFAGIFFGRYSKYLIGQGAVDMERRHNADMGAQSLAKAINIEITLMVASVVSALLSPTMPFLAYAVIILTFASVIASVYTITRIYNTYKLSEPILSGNAPPAMEIIEESIPEDSENIPEPTEEAVEVSETFDAGDEISGEGDGGDEE